MLLLVKYSNQVVAVWKLRHDVDLALVGFPHLIDSLVGSMDERSRAGIPVSHQSPILTLSDTLSNLLAVCWYEHALQRIFFRLRIKQRKVTSLLGFTHSEHIGVSTLSYLTFNYNIMISDLNLLPLLQLGQTPLCLLICLQQISIQ